MLGCLVATVISTYVATGGVLVAPSSAREQEGQGEGEGEGEEEEEEEWTVRIQMIQHVVSHHMYTAFVIPAS